MTEPDERRTPEDAAAEEAARKRRLAEIFGDVLPETTSDERDPDDRAGGRAGESASDEWLRRQVPPHHGS
jgi:hypothetical protein